ncbi:MAG: hypothetical protein ACRD63_09370 [Pyrinomonadaceae bacterium]
MDGVIWTPEQDTRGFISIVNTSSERRLVEPTFVVNGRSENLPPIEIAPRRFCFVSIDDLVARSQETGAGIHLAFNGNPGDIVAEGTLLRMETSFVKHIRFNNTSLKFADSSLRTNFLLLGRQPAEDDFPIDIAFRSVAVLRNVDTAPIQVTPIIKYLRNGSLQKITLNPVALGINESRLIDFTQEQKAGNLPADFNQGALELRPNTQHTSIVSELFNIDYGYQWSFAGPIPGKQCLQISEPSDPNAWHDNYICW